MNIPIYVIAESAWDPYTLANPIYQQFFNWRVPLMTGWTPWADPVVGWFTGNETAYVDSYAIYPDKNGHNPHPEQCLKDNNGTPLFIPYNCNNGTCPQWAADFSNKAFRAATKNNIAAIMANNYAGVCLDDVNLNMTVSDGNGTPVANLGVTPTQWTGEMIDWVTDIRTSFPKALIIHNPVWYAANDAARTQEMVQADVINIERGFGDPNLNPQTYMALMQYIDRIHSINRVMIQGEYSQNAISFTFPCFLLVCGPGDMFSCKDAFPGSSWPKILDIDPGKALGPRQMQMNSTGAVTWTRQYEHALVTVDFVNRTGVIQ